MADQPPPQTPPSQVEPATLPPVVRRAEAAHRDPIPARAQLGTKAAKVTVAADKPATVDFSFAPPAAPGG